MKNTLIFLAVLSCMGAASATVCPAGTVHAGSAEPIFPNRCNEGYNPPATGSTSGALAAAGAVSGSKSAADASATVKSANTNVVKASGGNAAQQQAQRQQQAQQQSASAEQAQSVVGAGQGAGAGAGASAGAGAGAGAGFNGDINISTGTAGSGGGGYSSRTTIIPPFVPGGAAPLPASNIAVVEGKCGGQVMAIARQVIGRETHTFGPTTEFVVGISEVVRPLTDGNGIPTPFDTTTMPGYVLGHVWYRTTQSAGTSMDASFAGSLFGKNAGGSAGVSAGGQVTRPMSEVDIQVCVIASPQPFVMPAPMATCAPILPPKPVYRQRVVRKPAPICTAWKS